MVVGSEDGLLPRRLVAQPTVLLLGNWGRRRYCVYFVEAMVRVFSSAVDDLRLVCGSFSFS
jgi:hypothetical protein